MSARLEILQYLSLEGIAETEDLVEEVRDSEDVETILTQLESSGYIENEGFWYLTDAGENELEALCRKRFSETELVALQQIHDKFEVLDSKMKALASDWQDDSVNTDQTIENLIYLQNELEDLFQQLPEETRDIYAWYLEELERAIEKIHDGQTEYFTGTEVSSYHTTWFKLHDDLLRTLGEKRDE